MEVEEKRITEAIQWLLNDDSTPSVCSKALLGEAVASDQVMT